MAEECPMYSAHNEVRDEELGAQVPPSSLLSSSLLPPSSEGRRTGPGGVKGGSGKGSVGVLQNEVVVEMLSR